MCVMYPELKTLAAAQDVTRPNNDTVTDGRNWTGAKQEGHGLQHSADSTSEVATASLPPRPVWQVPQHEATATGLQHHKRIMSACARRCHIPDINTLHFLKRAAVLHNELRAHDRPTNVRTTASYSNKANRRVTNPSFSHARAMFL